MPELCTTTVHVLYGLKFFLLCLLVACGSVDEPDASGDPIWSVSGGIVLRQTEGVLPDYTNPRGSFVWVTPTVKGFSSKFSFSQAIVSQDANLSEQFGTYRLDVFELPLAEIVV